MLRLLTFLTFLLATSATAAEMAPVLSDYLGKISASQPGNPRHSQATREVDNGALVVGFIEPDAALETMESQGLLYVVLKQANGAVKEIARSKPFAYYTSGGRVLVESIEISSATRFSIQFNHRGACTSGFEIYRFARIGKAWRVTGRDGTQFQCNPEDESMGDTRSEWTGNFLSGDVVAKEYRLNKLVSLKRSRKVFPALMIKNFSRFDAKHGPR